MSRPAEPGEVGILIEPGPSEGLALGARFLCLGRCHCMQGGLYRYRALDQTHLVPGVQVLAGGEGCMPKPWIIVLEDPDGGTDAQTREKEKDHATHV